MKFQELCGVIHLHTIYSDGGVDCGELINAAWSLGLDYAVVTDHMSMKGRTEGYEGFHGSLYVLIGYEHQDLKNHNHYLVMGTDSVLSEVYNPAEYIAAIRKKGGIGFIAHPWESRNYFANLPPYPWTDWKIDSFDGIEIWNQMSDWMEQLRSWRSIVRLMFPRRFMANAPSGLLRKWDDLNRTRFVPAIGGVDAHTRKIHFGIFSWTVFPIRVELQGIRTHLLIENSEAGENVSFTKQMLIDLLGNGKGFISNYRRGDARSSRFFLTSANGTVRCPGLSLEKTALPAVLTATIPEKAKICLVKDGIQTENITGREAHFSIDTAGVYRIEVYKGDRAWMYTNPFPVNSSLNTGNPDNH